MEEVIFGFEEDIGKGVVIEVFEEFGVFFLAYPNHEVISNIFYTN